MRRKHDAHKDEVEGVAQRLRNERPEASPLELDQIKTSAMSRAKAGTRRGRAGARRLATAGLTVGLLAAGTGGVIAGEGGHHGGNAANTQYGGECNISNGNGNIGDENGAGAKNNACNENSFNTTTITNTTTINNNNNTTSPVTVVNNPPPSSGVQGAKSTKARTSKRHIKLHINVSRKSKLKKVTLKVNGKIIKVLKGKQASTNINLVNLPCSNGATTVTITAVTISGKTITESHTYHLCQA